MKLYFELHGIVQRTIYGSRSKTDQVWYIITGKRTKLMRMTKYKQILKKL